MSILGLITGLAGPLATAASALAELYLKLRLSENDKERDKIKQDISEVEARKSVLIAEAGTRFGTLINASLRFLAAIGPIAYTTKLLLWDKVVGSFVGCAGPNSQGTCTTFSTDAIDANMIWVILGVYAFLFTFSMVRR